MKNLARAVRSPLLLLAFASAACAGTLDNPQEFDDFGVDAGTPATDVPDAATGADAALAPSCPDVPTMLAQTCGTAGCHDATTKAEALDLLSPGVTSRLVGVPSVEGSGLLINPANPSASVVYTKLLATPPFGARMPTGSPLDDATIQCVLAWVTSVGGGGAPPQQGNAGVEAAAPVPTIRVAAGQTSPVTDATGITWSADEGFTGGTAAVTSPAAAIAGTDTPALYNGQRYGDPTFSYLFTVPNGTYAVTLKFTEQYVTGPGMRLFGVAINGMTVETSFDIYAAAGAMNAAVDETFPVTVTGGSIQIDFTQGSVQFPKVDAIQIAQGTLGGDGGM